MPSVRRMRGDHRISQREKATPAKTGKQHVAELGADHLLDQDAHLLLEVEQAALAPVLDRVGVEDRGVDLGDRVLELGQALLDVGRGWR